MTDILKRSLATATYGRSPFADGVSVIFTLALFCRGGRFAFADPQITVSTMGLANFNELLKTAIRERRLVDFVLMGDSGELSFTTRI